MDAAWWGIPIVVILGASLVWFGWWNDRSTALEAAEAARRPVRAVPGLPADHRDPTYVLESDLAAVAPAPPNSAVEAVLARRDEGASLTAELADDSLTTTAESGVAVALAPQVLTLESALEVDADVATILHAAARRGSSLVVVAPHFADTVLATLRVNTRRGSLTVLPVRAPQEAALRRSAALSGGVIVSSADVRSGWLPPASWGSCQAWVATVDGCSVLTEDAGPSAPAPAPAPEAPKSQPPLEF